MTSNATQTTNNNQENLFELSELYKRTDNKNFNEKFAYHLLNHMGTDEVKRYVKAFPRELDFNIYQYGNLDIYDYDLYKSLFYMGLRTKAVLNYHNNLDVMPFPYKYREAIRTEYKKAIRYTIQYLKNERII